MNVEFARRTEIEGLYDAQELVTTVAEGARSLINLDGEIDRELVGDYAHWLLDVWRVARDKNKEVFCIGGTRKRVGETNIYGRLDAITAESKLVLSQRVALEDDYEQRTMVSFTSDWLQGQQTLNEVYVGWVLKDLAKNRSVEMNGVTLDFVKSEARLNSELKR